MNSGKIQVKPKDVHSFFCKRENFGESCNVYSEKKTIAEYIKSLYTPYFFLFFCKIAKVFACIMVFASRIAVLPAADGTQVTK